MKFDEPAAPGRRRFLGGVGAVVGGAALLRPQARAAAPNPFVPASLDSTEIETLIAAVGRLIPADASGGGAVEAHAHVYIDRALSSAYAAHLPTYRTGLAAIALLAKKSGGAAPRALASAGLDAILSRMDQGKVTEALDVPAGPALELADGGRTFFRLLLRHTLEGTFGDPAHGGNHDFLGWRLIGYPGIQLFYSDAEQSLNGPTAAKNRSVADFGRGEPAATPRKSTLE